MTHARAVIGSYLLLGACCFDAFSPHPPPTPLPPPSMPGTGTGPLLPGGSGTGTGLPISFGPGSADPALTQGYAGGPILANTMDPTCYAGHYAVTPSHVLTLSASMPYVRIMAYSAAGTDLTLFVRSPNGTATCNDDSDGLNPTVELIGAMPGEYQVYVGTYSAPGPEPYQLGVSVQRSIISSTMLSAPTTMVPETSAPPTPISGTPEHTGTATVSTVSGNVPNVSAGSTCTFTQSRVVATGGPGVLDCRWTVTCGGVDLYGGVGPGGYQPCTDPSWAVGTLAMDIHTTGTDTDPTLLFSGNVMTIGDDSSGPYGSFTVVALVQSCEPPLSP
jgi:hypothetical protein